MKLWFLFFRGLCKRYKLRFCLIALCALYCFMGQLSLSWADECIGSVQEDFEAACGTADVVVYTEDVAVGELSGMLGQIEGVQTVSEAMIAEPIRCTFSDGSVRSVRFLAFRDHGVITPMIEGEGEFALSYGYKVAFSPQELSFTLPDGEQVQVSATAAMDMYTGVYVDQFIPSTDGDIVDILAPVSRVEQIVSDSYVNYAVLTVADTDEVQRIIDEIYANKDIFVAYAARTEPAYEASLGLQAVISRLCSLFPWLMLAFGLVFVCVFLSGVAARSTDSIAILKTEGASGISIFWGIYAYGMAATLAGFVCAVPISIALADFMAGITLQNMGIPMTDFSVSVKSAFVGLVGNAILVFVAAWLGMLFVSGRWTARLRARHRSRVRNRWMCVALTAASTASAVCLVMMSMMFMDSLDAVRQEQFDDRYDYDVQVVYSGFVPLKQLEDLENSNMTIRCEPMIFGTMQLENGSQQAEVSCAALSKSPLLVIRDEQGNAMEVADNAIILSAHTADALGVQTGSLIKAQIRYGNTKIGVYCTVAGISHQASSFLEVISIDTVEQYLDSSGVMNSAAVQVRDGCLDAFVEYAQNCADVYAVQTGQAGQERFDQRYAGTKILIWVVTVGSILLGFSVCLLMCYIQWRGQIRRNTIEFMLGQSAVRILFRSGMHRLVGLLFGLVGGLTLAACVMPRVLNYLSTDSIIYPYIGSEKTIFIGILLCLSYEIGCMIMYALASRQQWTQPGNKI